MKVTQLDDRLIAALIVLAILIFIALTAWIIWRKFGLSDKEIDVLVSAILNKISTENNQNIAEKIEQLDKLRKDGLITEDEFQS